MFDRGLLSLVLYGLERAEVPTPAFNAHDHFQLAGAVRLAAQQATASTSVEVGSFAGHTALFSAAIFEALRVSNILHAVDPGVYGLQNYVKKSPLRSQIKLHLTTSKRMGPWATQLRFFFEDSLHNYDVTKQSFDIFEDSVVVGGVVLLHDVGCCSGAYPGLRRFAAERVYSNESYREVFFDVPTSWSDLDEGSAQRMLRHLNASLDRRRGFREKLVSSYGAAGTCDEICTKRRCRIDRGYQWSWCPNTRVFQRVHQ